MLLARNWKLYYQAKFTLFLVKNKTLLKNKENEIIIIEDKEGYVEWKKVEQHDGYEDIDFERYVAKINSD